VWQGRSGERRGRPRIGRAHGHPGRAPSPEDAQPHHVRRHRARQPERPDHHARAHPPRARPRGKRRRQLIESLLLRAEFGGRLADYDRASELAETLPDLFPDEIESHLLRASVRSTLHRFDAAWADLDEAERWGAPPDRTRGARASLLAARGQIDEALALQIQAHSAHPAIDTTGALAALLGDLGRREEALAAFTDAFESYEGTSPLPVAWLFFRQGQLWEKEGRKDLAIAYHQAALERMPAYAHAAAHLARLSPPDRAESILAPFTTSSDDPDIDAVLAEKARERGDTKAASDRIAKAAARYDQLVLRHPAAFADHAAQFWLDTANDPNKALDLARINLSNRRTVKAYQLAVLAALSAGDRAAACEIGTEALAAPDMTSLLRDTIRGACEKR
jgi:tetratricopeptide (TPR) repeat protein